MNKYSKINLVNNSTKSRSIDFSDLQSFPLETKTPNEAQEIIKIKPQEPKTQTNNTTLQKLSDSSSLNDDEETDDQSNKTAFRMMKLSRNRSVSVTTSSSNMFKIEKQSTNAVKRAFSMRRSSSVTERYSRIHDQSVSMASPLHDDGDEDMHTSVKKKKKKYSSILKACKRLLGI